LIIKKNEKKVKNHLLGKIKAEEPDQPIKEIIEIINSFLKKII
jgi:hypothetical protein